MNYEIEISKKLEHELTEILEQEGVVYESLMLKSESDLPAIVTLVSATTTPLVLIIQAYLKKNEKRRVKIGNLEIEAFNADDTIKIVKALEDHSSIKIEKTQV